MNTSLVRIALTRDQKSLGLARILLLVAACIGGAENVHATVAIVVWTPQDGLFIVTDGLLALGYGRHAGNECKTIQSADVFITTIGSIRYAATGFDAIDIAQRTMLSPGLLPYKVRIFEQSIIEPLQAMVDWNIAHRYAAAREWINAPVFGVYFSAFEEGFVDAFYVEYLVDRMGKLYTGPRTHRLDRGAPEVLLISGRFGKSPSGDFIVAPAKTMSSTLDDQIKRFPADFGQPISILRIEPNGKTYFIEKGACAAIIPNPKR